MSQENVDFVRALYGTAGSMDKGELLAALPALIEQGCDPEIEWHEDPQRADACVYRGHEGVLRSFEQWLEGFDEYGVVLEEAIDCGDDVFVASREEGRGAASGATVSSSIYQVFTFRDGKVLRYREFYDRRRAEEAAGRTG
jgi:ketosteroid isomerase-like protein